MKKQNPFKLASKYVNALGLRDGLSALASTYVSRGQLRSMAWHGGKLWLRDDPADRAVFRQVFIDRDYETHWWKEFHARLQRRYQNILSEGETPLIIDAGANIGIASIWFAEQWPEAKIIAVEPDQANYEMLERNAKGRPIMPLCGAVWDRPTRLHIANPRAASDAFRVIEGDGDLRAYAIPDLTALEPRGRLFIVKIDIEGGEAALFRSNTDWMKDTALIIMEPHDWLYPGEHTTQTFRRAIADMPIELVQRGENLFCFA